MPMQTLNPPRPTQPRLRGRDAELELLGERLAAAAAGHGAVVVVEGPAGIGKSRIVAEALEMARRAGARRLTASAHDLDEGTPLGPLLSAVVGAEERLLDPSALRELAGAPDGRFWLLEELHGALERAALDGPLLVALDDLQWADPATSWALRTLIPRLAGWPVVWLLAARPDAGLAAALETADVLSLGALEPDAVAAVAGDVLGGTPDERVLELAARAGGNPFLLVELLRGLAEEERVVVADGEARLDGPVELPARVAESMGARLARLGDAAREAVELASVLGPRFSALRLAELLDRQAHTLVAPLREALQAGLLTEHGDELAFRHDLLREGVYAALPKPVRDALHRQVAGALLAGGGTAAEAARHLLVATLPADRATIDVLRAAARELATTSPGAAAELGVRAISLAGPHDGLLGALAAETIPLLAEVGRHDEARAVADRALTGHIAPDEEARVRAGLAQLLGLHDVAAAEAECRRGLELAGVAASTRAELLAILARATGLRGDMAHAARAADEALAVARDAGHGAAEVLALTELGLLAFRADRWDEALERLEQAVAAAERGGPGARALTIPELWRDVVVGLRDGVDEALADATRRNDAASRDGRQWELRVWTMARSLLLLDAGRLGDARAEAEALLTMHAEADTGSLGVAVARFVAARVGEHVTGDALPAAVQRPTGLHDPADVPRAVRAALQAADAAGAVRAAELAEDVATRAAANPGIATLDGAAAHAAGLVVAASGSLGLARTHLHDAVAVFRRSPRVLALASALEDLGAVAGEAGEQAEAVAALDEALTVLVAAGAEHDAARVRRRLRALGVRRRRAAAPRAAAATGWDALTDSERQVARLIAAGATNREAAEQLFVSPHTVSTHLRHAFAKLGINSRVQLAHLAHDHATI